MTVAEDPAKAAEPDVHVPPPTAPPVVQATVVETKPSVESAPAPAPASAVYPRTGSKTPYVHNKPCPNCGTDGKGKMTIMTSKVSSTGWIVCVALFCIFWPCCWVPLIVVRLLCRYLFVSG